MPKVKLLALSSGEFVGMVADNPEHRIQLKMFNAAIQNDHAAIAREEAAYQPIPVPEVVTEEIIAESYQQIKDDIAGLLKKELDELKDKPDNEKGKEGRSNDRKR